MGTTKNASSPAALMAGGGDGLGRARGKEVGWGLYARGRAEAVAR
jgi:hypothetical protein